MFMFICWDLLFFIIIVIVIIIKLVGDWSAVLSYIHFMCIEA